MNARPDQGTYFSFFKEEFPDTGMALRPNLSIRHEIQNEHNFKFWGCFIMDKLVGWQSLLPCQSAPMVWHKHAEASTYIKPDNRYQGVGRTLLCHAIQHARLHSELAYIIGYASNGNPHVEKLVQEVGFQKIGPLPKSSKDDICGQIEDGEPNSQYSLVVYCVPL